MNRLSQSADRFAARMIAINKKELGMNKVELKDALDKCRKLSLTATNTADLFYVLTKLHVIIESLVDKLPDDGNSDENKQVYGNCN